ncbi:hypothetical protein XELAEV_18004921mg [Xenopus laevis]|uniref:Homeobox domain-containing protein n=1 Tax=Xenopus laevis TaxID=8355 RepID=A0A974DX33_XENLA|nr:hypothetical protein XELAEV_18004921mg [Xenopus laevis]
MFQPAGKRCFTIESLVAKDNPLSSEEPLRPATLQYPATPAEAFVSGFPSPAGRSIYNNPELVFPETVTHPPLTVSHPHQLGAPHLQHPHSFFAPQHRDPLNFYPWVLRNRFFGHRFQGSDVSQESLLLHGPFARKPKRIRTAFSPSQLLRLERAFEKNHYVVGAERKQLASSLSLSETQRYGSAAASGFGKRKINRGGGSRHRGMRCKDCAVNTKSHRSNKDTTPALQDLLNLYSLLPTVKVWFQNRRTKYKRQKLEEEGPDSDQKKKGSHHINRWRMATKQPNGEDIDVTSND